MNASVVRVGDTVRRSASAATPAVHALLVHLAGRGYPAPRPLGIDRRGREMLTFIDGNAVHPDHLDLIDGEAALRRVGALIAGYHRAQADFTPPPDAVWSDLGRDPTGSTEIVTHNDLAPWNLVAGAHTWAFIDWDLAAPGRRSWDLAWALHSFAGLWPADDFDHERAARRISAFCDGADVAAAERPALLDVVAERTGHHAAQLRCRAADGDEHYQRMVTDGHADAWQRGSDHVAQHRDHWADLLRR